MVKVGKLWGEATFNSLSPDSKLLYLYIVTSPYISTLGVLVTSIERIELDLKFGQTYETTIQESIDELKDNEFLVHLKDKDYEVFIVKDHFLSLSKSKLNIRKAIDEGKKSRYRSTLLEIYEASDFEPSKSFVPPTPKEVADYAMSLGYIVDGKAFVKYYGDNDWYNKNNKKVRSWKKTLERVWCREENKLNKVDGAPDGFEYFYIEVDEGVRHQPEGWKNGKPTHSNFLLAQLLLEEFNVRNS